jgi:SAM-dependent methyltransferase
MRDRRAGPRSSLADEAFAVAAGAKGIEIGGPSDRFQEDGILPLYPIMSAIDNVNFSARTLWENALEEGMAYSPAGNAVGAQFLREATDLHDIPEDSYDIVLSSHCLEHIANPLRALREWRRVCRPGGNLLVVVPHRDATFDWKRPITTIEHYRLDAEKDVDEGDSTHFDEVLRCHDLSLDPGVSSFEELCSRVAGNREIRGVHHHVFDLRRAVQLISEAGWRPTAAKARRPCDIMVLAQNSTGSSTDHKISSVLRGSPFRSDHRRFSPISRGAESSNALRS